MKPKFNHTQIIPKIVLLVQVFLSHSVLLQSQTNVGGIIESNTLWTLTSSPYIVTTNIVVSPEAELTIEPGVEVRFKKNCQLWLKGKLTAHGTLLDTIRFVPEVIPTDWGIGWNGIKVDNTFNAKVDISYFKASYSELLFRIQSPGSLDTLIKLKHCMFYHNKKVIVCDDEVKTHIGFIDSCYFYYTLYDCIFGSSNYTVTNSRFVKNRRASYNSRSQWAIFDQCEFSGSSEGALVIEGSITNSTFYDNVKGIITMGSGPVIKYNNIHDNETGIYLYNYGSNDLSGKIKHNRICNNIRNTDKIYGTDAYVTENCWCSNDSTEIAGSIRDFFEAPNLGIVYFMPFEIDCDSNGTVNIDTLLNNANLIANLFPVPVENFFIMELRTLKHESIQIIITDIIGQNIHEIYSGVISSGSNILRFNTDYLSSGIYLLSVISESERATRRLVKP